MEGDGVCTTFANPGLTPTRHSFEVDDSRSCGTDDPPRTSRWRACLGTCTCTRKTRLRVAETVGLGTVIVIVWGLLLLPVIFYHLSNESGDHDKLNGTMESCDHDVKQKYISVCSSSSRLGKGRASIDPITYQGSVCLEELNSLTNCLLEDGSKYSHPLVVTTDNKSNAEMALFAINLASRECAAEVKPFLCLYFFGLMSDTSNRVYYQPSAGHCKNLRDDICASEWTSVESFYLSGVTQLRLPDCNEEFPSHIDPCNEEGGEELYTDNDIASTSGSGLLLPLNDTTMVSDTASEAPTQQQSLSPGCNNITCREGFYCIERDNNSHGYCNPSCYSWNQYPRATNIVVDFMVLLAACIGVLAAIGVLVAAVARRKQVFVFPSNLAVYQTITVLVVALFIIVGYVDNRTLYCASENLYTSLAETTAFCVITGVVLHYALVQLAIFWLCHVLVLFWGLKFPFHWRTFKSTPKLKYIHLSCVLIGLLGPFVPVIVTMSKFSHGKSAAEAAKGGLGFGITRFPSLLCSGSDEKTVFYALVLPIIFIIMVGMAILVLVFWIVHKQHGLFRERQFGRSTSAGYFKIGTAERKLLIVFVYYVLLTAISLVSFSLSIRDREPFITKVQEYFSCERGGVDPDNNCDEYITSYLKHRQVALISISHVLLGLYPVVNFIYVINVRELKEYAKKWLPCWRGSATL